MSRLTVAWNDHVNGIGFFFISVFVHKRPTHKETCCFPELVGPEIFSFVILVPAHQRRTLPWKEPATPLPSAQQREEPRVETALQVNKNSAVSKNWLAIRIFYIFQFCSIQQFAKLSVLWKTIEIFLK
jgi:hypothetical protein